MALITGHRLGPYEILAIIGEGGMGQVYRARDTKLQRHVAIKVLPDAVTGDAERIARFDREARTLATLNHPHIAQIYGTEQSGITHALVMELVEGEDLAQRYVLDSPNTISSTRPQREHAEGGRRSSSRRTHRATSRRSQTEAAAIRDGPAVGAS